MTQNLPTTAFTFQDHTVRTLTEEDGSLWFVARDVCDALGISWRGNTLDSIPENWRGMRSFRTPLQNQHGVYGEQDQEFVTINEPALYKLAFRSNKPAAEDFTNWVASEVLPAIRRTGRFSGMAPALATEAPDREDQIRLARKLVTQVNAILRDMPALSRLYQDLGVSVNDVLRTLCVLSPDIHHEAYLQSLRDHDAAARPRN
ncbi:BRO family protein [Desulfobotulus sp. H1]|uniref:BRO family protein n=1 Tax=Desulfobotulus pelophilus TaxID=2823377 RepID=A0ABT3ND67_9BACT|nr:BRO family protein [Desulfobotulus pelophilus]MCW7755409.1 BRO family protein [Desulfobotulus pelophilus]